MATHFTILPDDDPAYMQLAARAVLSAAREASSTWIHLVKIDTWFGDEWFSFSGKIPARTVYQPAKLALPPFHSHRVVNEARFLVDDPKVVSQTFQSIHPFRDQAGHRQHFVEVESEPITYAWITSNTKTSDRAAIMVYHVGPGEPTGWYVGLTKNISWHAAKFVQIDNQKWKKLAESPVNE